MQTHANQQHKQRGRVPGIAMAMSRAVAIAMLLSWAPSSIGSANHDSVPARLPAVPAQTAGAKETPAAGRGSRDSTNFPICAEFRRVAATQNAERSGESTDIVGCGVSNNLAGGMPASNQSEERVDVATFLVWHVQGRNVGQYAYQTTLSGPSRTEATDYRPSALTVAAPFRNMNTR